MSAMAFAEPWRSVAESGKPEAPQMGSDLISVAKPPLSRDPSGPQPRAGDEGEADTATGPQRPENSAEPGPERPATQWQERKDEGEADTTTGPQRPENSAA